jgi:hypothetical protein
MDLGKRRDSNYFFLETGSMQKNQSRILIALLGAIVLLLATIVVVFLTKGNQTAKVEPQKVTESENRQPEEKNYPVATTVQTIDSVRVSDPIKFSAIESFFQQYSGANRDGLVEELTMLYTDPSYYVNRSYSRSQLRKVIINFFDRTRTIDHSFSNLVAYELSNGTVSVYVSEYQETSENQSGRIARIKVYKNFHLIPTNSGYKCEAQYILSHQQVK